MDDGFDEQIVGNVEWLLAGRQNNPSSAELVVGIAGTEEVWIHTFQTEEGLGRENARFVRESGMGTKHRGREYYESPDDIKRLAVGRMLLVEKSPPSRRGCRRHARRRGHTVGEEGRVMLRPDAHDALTVAEVARELRLSEKTVRRAISSGERSDA